MALLERHLAFHAEHTPAEHVHALDVEALCAPDVTFLSQRDDDGTLLGVVALKELGPSHGELKSMHTVAARRGEGTGRLLVEHVLALAAERGYERVSLETGTQDAYEPARRLYASCGFEPCAPFAGYADDGWSACMTRSITSAAAPATPVEGAPFPAHPPTVVCRCPGPTPRSSGLA